VSILLTLICAPVVAAAIVGLFKSVITNVFALIAKYVDFRIDESRRNNQHKRDEETENRRLDRVKQNREHANQYRVGYQPECLIENPRMRIASPTIDDNYDDFECAENILMNKKLP
jgi:hypothetical protein